MRLALLPSISDAKRIENLSLEELLTQELLRYGKPRLSFLDKGWYCKVEMNTNTVGTQFDVASAFDQPTPLHAARMCHERILNALRELNK